MKTASHKFLPPEWYPQSGIMLTWPHRMGDWSDLFDEVESCFVLLAREILKHEKLLVVCDDPGSVAQWLEGYNPENLLLSRLETNDTWSRDHGPVTVFVDGIPVLHDFQFNGWGLKFAACLDNQVTSSLYRAGIFSTDAGYENRLDFVLEGGSFESDGAGTLLVTEECLLSRNRNEKMSRNDIGSYLKEAFGLQRILWLSAGYLAGDDTDSHVDTLARFCDANTIAYVACDDSSDEHYAQLKLMEEELRSFRTLQGEAYKLIALPMAEPVYDEQGTRLPATYANFLIMNDCVLVPFYSTSRDEIARQCLEQAFPGRKVTGIDCSVLIRQHGSLHCVTMQLPEGVLP